MIEERDILQCRETTEVSYIVDFDTRVRPRLNCKFCGDIFKDPHENVNTNVDSRVKTGA